MPDFTPGLKKPEKICLNCQFIHDRMEPNNEGRYLCLAPQNQIAISMVTGKAIYKLPTCIQARAKSANDGGCGEDATWYQQRTIDTSLIADKGKTQPEKRSLEDKLGM